MLVRLRYKKQTTISMNAPVANSAGLGGTASHEIGALFFKLCLYSFIRNPTPFAEEPLLLHRLPCVEPLSRAGLLEQNFYTTLNDFG